MKVPYRNLRELPESVQHVLPKHAQEIYLAAFNHAWEEYKKPEDRRGDDSREEVAHKVAWSAVKHSYKKRNNEWQRKENIQELPESLQKILPEHAQEIYLAAFKSAWEQYKHPEDRRGNDAREDVAHKVAWAAVKHIYEKRDNKWQRIITEGD